MVVAVRRGSAPNDAIKAQDIMSVVHVRSGVSMGARCEALFSIRRNDARPPQLLRGCMVDFGRSLRAVFD